MGSNHNHTSSISSANKHKKTLVIAFCLTGSYMIVEFVVGFAINSLALISDATHMATDVTGLSMALAAIMLASRKNSQRTFGFYRLEVLAALANGLLLFGVAGYVIFEAIKRFNEPPEVPGIPLLIVALIGLTINVTSYMLLRSGSKESLNLKGASLEVFGDMLGSVGVIVAAIVLYTTGWRYADPIIGVAIGLFILPRTAKLMRQTLRILLESAPPEINVEEVQSKLEALPGVQAVHDLHIWTITSGIASASGHIVVKSGQNYDQVLEKVLTLFSEAYAINHVTMQCESQKMKANQHAAI